MRRRLGRLFPRTAHKQIALLACVFLVLSAVVFTLGMAQLVSVRSNVDRADRELAPAIGHLARAERGFSASHDAFEAMLDSSDELERAALLTAATARQEEARASWTRFLRQRGSAPGTATAIAAVDYAIAQLGMQGAAVLNSGGQQTLTDFEATFDSLDRNVDLLELTYASDAREATHAASVDAESAQVTVIAASAVVLLVFLVTTTIAVQLTRRREQREQLAEVDRARQADRDELDARLQRALEMTSDEESAFAVLDAALQRSIPDTLADLLVAESPRGTLRRVASTIDPSCEGACGVSVPGECPAASRGKTMLFSGHDALDACPTRDRHGASTAATTCVPVNIGGQAAGVICATGPVDVPVDAKRLGIIELLARKAGERLTLMRAFARTENLAATDPLTGLANRRNTEAKVDELVAHGHRYVLAYGDLDHFKLINDVYGHDIGDRALRLFARTLRDSVRPSDIPCRYGGEEFVIVLPDCSVDEATGVLDRLRSRLEASLANDDVPRFTVSFGLSQTDDGRSFADVVNEADAALLHAKVNGRDQLVVATRDG